MLKKYAIAAMAAALLTASGGVALASDKEAGADKPPKEKQEWIYGSQLMSAEERAAHREKMRAAKTAEERDQICNGHHEQMKERAKAKGVTLPDVRPGRGCGPGMGPRGRNAPTS
jgi:hypothetical protein